MRGIQNKDPFGDIISKQFQTGEEGMHEQGLLDLNCVVKEMIEDKEKKDKNKVRRERKRKRRLRRGTSDRFQSEFDKSEFTDG